MVLYKTTSLVKDENLSSDSPKNLTEPNRLEISSWKFEEEYY